MADIILVNEHGEEIGTADTIEAHTGKGLLHRAFSVYVFRNDRKELLLQKRSDKKMLWPLIWANTCCSHPKVGETAREAGERRLKEEMGFTCPLSEGETFVYRAEDPSGKGLEHEHDTILIGEVEGAQVVPDPNEVAEYKWMDVKELLQDMKTNEKEYAPWFHIGLTKIFAA